MTSILNLVVYVVLALLVILVIVLFVMVSRLKKKVNNLSLTLLNVQEQAARGGVDMDTSGFRRQSAPVPVREANPVREGGRVSVQDKRGGRAVVQPSATPAVRPVVGNGKPGRVVQSDAAPVNRGPVTGAGMRPMAAPTATAEPEAYGAEEYFNRGKATASQAPKKGRGKPVIPFGEGRAAREAAYNKYAGEAVEQDIAPDSIDFSKVAAQLNLNQNQQNLGVYDPSQVRRVKGDTRR